MSEILLVFATAFAGAWGTLQVDVIDAATGEPTPARMELHGADDEYYVARNALFMETECLGYLRASDMSRYELRTAQALPNPYTDTIQFYAPSTSHFRLPPQRYRLRVFKGIEYAIAEVDVEIREDERKRLTIPLERSHNLAAEGWYSAEGHVHLGRKNKSDDERLMRWMQAEDIHVANVLESGSPSGAIGPEQSDYGREGVYRVGDYLLMSSQENPRTHIMGHAVIIGAPYYLHLPNDKYLLYELFWRQAERYDALYGYAHGALPWGGRNGVAIDYPWTTFSFIEGMQNDNLRHYVWYEMLNLGARLPTVSGTDFPCAPTLPGRSRFYTRVEGPFSLERWFEGVRAGRTFVTNGPFIEFAINGKGLGEQVTVEAGSDCLIEGLVRYHSDHCVVERVEIVQNGEVVESIAVPPHQEEYVFQTSRRISENSWFAVRAAGARFDTKLAVNEPAAAWAHTSPIYVEVPGAVPMEMHARAQTIRQKWIETLDEFAARIQSDNLMSELSAADGSDWIPKSGILAIRKRLLEAIARSREYYESMQPDAAGDSSP